jgi:murein DD-endopeptidase MepM/ murein hydrolase activator NlpD
MSCVVELLRSWSHPRAIVLTAIAIGTAGCSSETLRFNDNPFSSQSAPSEVTGSVPARTAPLGRVESNALPPPAASRPVTTATAAPAPHYETAGGGRGLASYHPAPSSGPEVTGSVQSPPPPARAPAPASQWSWDGGTAVTVGRGETVDSIAHRHGVPRAAILQANNLSAGQAIYPGQRLVIPRHNQAAAPAVAQPAVRPVIAAAAKPALQAPPNNGLGVHIVAPGDTLIKIAHIYKKPVVEIAKANNIQPQATLHIGEKIVIPGLRAASVQHKETTKVAEAKPAAVPAESKTVVAAAPAKTPAGKSGKQAAVTTSEPTQTAAVLTPANETPTATTGAVKSAEGAPPSFRWPVKARVIAGFGPRPNGQQNDGINLAVPEGTPVKAAEDGVVAYAGSELKGYGNLVLVRHSNGYVTAYAHAKELMVKRGDPIKRGQVIAKSGQTGNVDAPQLHFEIRKGPAPMDPMPMLSGG